jgi:hypothetical protein
MAICAVCSAPCRGKCGRCGARLCATHRPSSARAKCAICRGLPTGAAQVVQAISAYPATSAQPMARPGAQPQVAAVSLASLDLADQLAWIAERRTALQQKRQFEQDYLDRRAARATHTPTDEQYERDAVLEYELLEALDLLATCLQTGSAAPAPGSTSLPASPAGVPSMLLSYPDPDDPHGKLVP